MRREACTCEADAREHYQRHVTPDEVAWWCGMFGCSTCTTAHAYCEAGGNGDA